MYVWVLVVHATITGTTIDVYGDTFATKQLCEAGIAFMAKRGMTYPAECLHEKVRTE